LIYIVVLRFRIIVTDQDTLVYRRPPFWRRCHPVLWLIINPEMKGTEDSYVVVENYTTDW